MLKVTPVVIEKIGDHCTNFGVEEGGENVNISTVNTVESFCDVMKRES